MTIHSDEMWPRMLPAHVEAFIVDTVGMIRELDETDLSEMTPLPRLRRDSLEFE